MIDFLLGVPGKLKTISDWLTTYWTSARAAKLDYLTANVAVASTAVSNADYTSGRAAKLDGIIQNTILATSKVQSGTMNQVSYTAASGGAPGAYLDITISAVDVTKAVVTVCGSSGDLNYTALGGPLYARLTSATNLRIYWLAGKQYAFGTWLVVEYK